ncbi:putative kinesin [Leptomonas pyrrhocoris]|uniref:Putative kinesin n=1 Tax=Leptomonas pyrrhocoris TaxID=157538 RepID=A0A0M9G2I6_LEPPY|nr:putative kinesin [Leptomonas pyrrhocoris]XP_015659540.1 putative kinesin [Leptomonas pyrrhocoris]KPA81100.1 putative kinesin [Leptomonas pyrrhocoris]KPA81101.1 putative kinesin [Leptomonas pyrrhocoris]|eukprot:XP_015659539.1 putative kinesin [Leptomonas pyrrhocoris]
MSIEVHVRIRPSVGNIVWSSAETVLYSTANPNTRYVYNKVHPSNSTNALIFREMEAIVHAGFDGKNVTVMAYGQTGSGKTHSMIGVDDDPGIVPRAAKLLLELKRNSPGTTIKAFYTEIYNETVRDLLDTNQTELALHDAPDGGVAFEKKMIDVQSYEDFLKLQNAAERNRKYGVTNLNEHSSRSHIILTFEIHRVNRLGKTVINLVDLAGSESASRANTEGLSLREGGYINRSLLTLGNVVDAIVEKRPYVPYRDAKLTRILRTCLGGVGITFILCCVNPSRENFDQTVATLRFTQRAMKIKNDPVVLLNIPPFFTHQYSDGARQLIEGLKESAEAEYQRGLQDSYFYCNTTVGSVVGNYHTQVSDCLHSLANGQRLLVAHDHAMAIDHIGRLYNQLNDLTRQRTKNKELAENERKRQGDITTERESRKVKIAKFEEELNAKLAAVDADMANWEYQLYDARQKQRSDVDVLLQSELARRARIQYEWAVCFERVASRFVPVLRNGLTALKEKLIQSTAADGEAGSAALPVVLLSQEDDSSRLALQLKELRVALVKARDEVADLETAHEMVRDDIEEAKRQQQQQCQDMRSSASVSPQPRPNLADMTEEELITYYRGVPDSDVEERIHRLEREEKALMAQARRGVRRESLRRVRESLRVSRGSHGSSRSPQGAGGGGVTITRRPDLDATAGGTSSNTTTTASQQQQKQQRGRGDAESRAMESHAQVEARGRRSSTSYADGVKNALSILDSLKAQLQRKVGGIAAGGGGGGHASPTVASASRSQQSRLQRQESATSTQRHRSTSGNSDGRRRRGGKTGTNVEETAVYHDPEGREAEAEGPADAVGSSDRPHGRQRDASARHRSSPPRTTGNAGAAHKRPAAAPNASDSVDSENMTLAELYQASVGKENWSRSKPTGAARPTNKYTVIEADNAAFDVDGEEIYEAYAGGDVDDRHLTSSTPVGIAARRKMERQHSRPAVERALYSLNSNSHSPSASVERRSRSRRA